MSKALLDGLDQPGVEHLADGIHVVGQAAHQVASFVLVKKGQRQALHAVKDVGAQLIEHLVADDDHAIEAAIAGRPGPDVRGQKHEHGHGQPRLVAPDDELVDGPADQVGTGQLQQRIHDDQNAHAQQARAGTA